MNAPVGYDYTPNTVQLDQAVVYIERRHACPRSASYTLSAFA
jgi:hypothetical protein